MISVGILLTPGVCCSKVEQPGSNNVGEIMTGLELFGKKNLQKNAYRSNLEGVLCECSGARGGVTKVCFYARDVECGDLLPLFLLADLDLQGSGLSDARSLLNLNVCRTKIDFASREP